MGFIGCGVALLQDLLHLIVWALRFFEICSFGSNAMPSFAPALIGRADYVGSHFPCSAREDMYGLARSVWFSSSWCGPLFGRARCLHEQPANQWLHVHVGSKSVQLILVCGSK